jgi:predicted transcriptional regulator
MALSKSSAMPTSKETVTIYLPEDVKQKLLEIAKTEKRSMAFMGEQFILEGIKNWEKRQKRNNKDD